MSLRASIHTLGCRLNQADSAHLAAQLRLAGYELVPWGEAADVLVVNSCAVTATAVQKSRQLLRSVRKRFPDAYVVYCGCAASDAEARLAVVEAGLADMVLPNPKPSSLPSLLPSMPRRGGEENGTVVLPRPWQSDGFILPGVGENPERTRANLKIQEGCDFRCTYCIVPDVRGPAVSRDLSDVLREADELLRRGYRELVVTGVNIATYANSGCGLAELLRELLRLRGPGDREKFRIRLGSAEPGPALERVIDVMKEDRRLCRFLHLPLQYGDDAILKRMGRHYDTSQYAETVLGAAKALPGICLGTDLMVGFPGEDASAYRRCRELLESLPIGLMHVFSYSPRPGTPAAQWSRPPSGEVAERETGMLALASAKAAWFLESQAGQRLEVLLESGRPCFHGWSDNYLKVVCDDPSLALRDGFVQCRVAGVRNVSGREVDAEVVNGTMQ